MCVCVCVCVYIYIYIFYTFLIGSEVRERGQGSGKVVKPGFELGTV